MILEHSFLGEFNAWVTIGSLIVVPIVGTGTLAIAFWRLEWKAVAKLFGILAIWALLTAYVLVAEIAGCMGGGCADGRRDFPLSVLYLVVSLGVVFALVLGQRRWAPAANWDATSLVPTRVDASIHDGSPEA